MPPRSRSRPATPGPFAPRLLAWFDANRRDLPWRRTADPWAIWVSEVMLQQTRVEAVRAAWSRFVARYPTPADFATASDDELQAAWRGLGYYRRARLLRDGAAQVVREHGGTVPADVAKLGELPGIGAYTLGAVASIAFGQRVIAIDGNVERVAARHLGLEVDPRRSVGRQAIAAAVRDWQDAARPGDFNQALMELGALVCTPQRPACERCPVASDCRARALGAVDRLPLRAGPAPVRSVTARAILAVDGGRVFGHRLPAGAINGGQIDLPGPGSLEDCDPDDLPAVLRQRHGCVATVGEALVAIRHAITSHRIVLHVHAAVVQRRGTLQAFPADDPAVPWTTLARKAFARALRRDAD